MVSVLNSVERYALRVTTMDEEEDSAMEAVKCMGSPS